MFEVELTAEVNNPVEVYKKLQEFSDFQRLKYFDRYFDKENDLEHKEQELRVRIKENQNTGELKSVLTLKDSPFDKKTRSKPEYEPVVEEPEQAVVLLDKLGFRQKISYNKYCDFFAFRYSGRDIEVSYVTFDEIPETFIEIETLVNEESQTPEAFKVVYELLEKLNVPQADLTTLMYQTRIHTARKGNL